MSAMEDNDHSYGSVVVSHDGKQQSSSPGVEAADSAPASAPASISASTPASSSSSSSKISINDINGQNEPVNGEEQVAQVARVASEPSVSQSTGSGTSSSSGLKISSVINNPLPTERAAPSSTAPLSTGSSSTGPPSSASPAMSASTAGTSQSMQLNDAFAYLDKVRAEFSDQPEIYNKFLQVMREFKANTIDANGVIVRVIQLFKGHRNLILGFNAFLPKTHHIDPNIQDFSRWAQQLPMGGVSSSVAPASATGEATATATATATSTAAAAAAAAAAGYPRPPSAGGYYVPPGGATSTPTPMSASVPVAPVIAAAGTSLGSVSAPSIPAVGPSSAVVRGSNVQFNRAVSFVEKIKNRFTTQPETYRAFLGILHSFHRDQRGIKEVHAQVQQLFRNEPDLLDEFSHFLPDNNAGGVAATRAAPGTLPPVGRFSSQDAFSAAQTAGTGYSPRAGPSAPVAPGVGGGGKRAAAHAAAGSERPKRARPFELYGVSKTADETEFFEKVKKYLGSRQVYAEFLKCLSLFSQDILKLSDLIGMVHNFIGGSEELFSWFKRYINYKEGDGPLWTTGGGAASDSAAVGGGSLSRPQSDVADETLAPAPELNVKALKRIGCYRIYPRGYRLSRASGRTILCDEVLNDEMLSCASFESEDAGFLSSKKNQYEDALFKCEDERFEMDLLLEYNLSTIAVLEPIARRLEALDPTERKVFRLNHRLNGTSEIIYKKAIKRIYGDKGDDIYEYLQRNPAATVPVVLRRLKQKDEEWRRVQRDWNRVWQEIHIKNYYKALDHQGIDFKAADRKTLTLRSLVHEIATVREERRRMADRMGTAKGSTSPHLALLLGDSVVLRDLLHLVAVAIRTSPAFSSTDRKSLTRFFSTFVPEFFRVEGEGGNGSGVGVANVSVLASASDGEALRDDGEESDSGSGNNDGSSSAEDSLDESSGAGAEEGVVGDGNVASLPSLPSRPARAAPASLLLYANDALFVFVRIFMIAYDRLEKMRQTAVASRNQPFFTEKTNVVAQFLDLHSRQATMTVDEELAPGRDFYSVLLYLTEQLIDGDIESGLFEEKVRYMFGTTGYVMFTFDRVVLALLRQTLTLLNDATCENLIRLYDSWRTRKGPRTSEYSVRLAAENIVNETKTAMGAGAGMGGSQTGSTGGSVATNGNLYRIEHQLGKRQLTIHLIDRLSSSGPGAAGTIEEKWSVYVDNFVKLESNDAYLNPRSRVFLRRNRATVADDCMKDLLVLYNLECKICINTYKIFYVENTEDFLVRRLQRTRDDGAGDANQRQRRRERLEAALKVQF